MGAEQSKFNDQRHNTRASEYLLKSVDYNTIIRDYKPPDSGPCSHTLSKEEAECYIGRYSDLEKVYGGLSEENKLKALRHHWKTWGCTEAENRIYACEEEEDMNEISNDPYQEETTFLSHPNLDMPTIDGRYQDANIRTSKNYQKYMALTITTIAILGITSYKMSKK
jgi:hypothetical protein